VSQFGLNNNPEIIRIGRRILILANEDNMRLILLTSRMSDVFDEIPLFHQKYFSRLRKNRQTRERDSLSFKLKMIFSQRLGKIFLSVTESDVYKICEKISIFWWRIDIFFLIWYIFLLVKIRAEGEKMKTIFFLFIPLIFFSTCGHVQKPISEQLVESWIDIDTLFQRCFSLKQCCSEQEGKVFKETWEIMFYPCSTESKELCEK
jgi:hypothetical protein